MSRIVLVTGGTRGIGAAISLAFKAAGYRVAANYARSDKAAKAFEEAHQIPTYKWNVARLDECEKGVAKLSEDLGGTIEVLVNNAGITRDGTLHKLSETAWHDVIETNLTSCFHMCRSVIGTMREQRFGRIINISSINAQAGQLGQTNYSAAKAGMLGFTKALAREGASRGITVNSVAPGYIKTDMTESVPADIMQAIVQQIPVKRLGRPEEIARAVLFLADDHSGFITGETLSVNGGHHME